MRLRLRFVDFFPGFVAEDSFFCRWLREWGYDVELCDEPDYVIFSVFGNEHLRFGHCVKIFWTGENQVPDFNFCDYAIGFDPIAFGDRYLRFPQFLTYNPAAYGAMLERTSVTREELAAKTGFCAFVYSNDNASPERQQFFGLLSRYRAVSSGGRYLNNVGGPVADKLDFQRRHKFVIAFENSSSPGYTTEKLMEAFASRAVPIYWGDPEVGKEFNPRAFINCADYPSFDAVVERVRQLDADDEAWLAMMHEPPLHDAALHDAYMERLREFLHHIFAQPKSAAFRYNRQYWGAKLVKHRQQEVRAFDRSLYGRALRFYMKHVYQRARHGDGGLLYRCHRWLMKAAGR